MATITSPLVEHDVQVIHEDRPWAFGYRAVCVCGWASDCFNCVEEAEWAVGDHYEIAVVAIDRLMGELLDTQDDLAAVVEWLAEHWSANLPIPWRATAVTGEACVVKLLVTCSTAATLARVADLLNVEAQDDRAQRSFGLVAIEAYVNDPETHKERAS
jgi:hypothetical protein